MEGLDYEFVELVKGHVRIFLRRRILLLCQILTQHIILLKGKNDVQIIECERFVGHRIVV